MSTWTPNILKLDAGVDTYSPPLVGTDLAFLYLDNLEPKLGRLYCSLGHALYQLIGTGVEIISFGMYHLSNRQGTNIYAFSRTSVYWYDIATGAFVTTPIYTGFVTSADPYVIFSWYDCLYATKPNCPLVRFEYKTPTVISGGIFGRYGVVANAHAYLGAAGDSISNQLGRIRWSDLDDPESWNISPNDSEADFFDLEPEERAITGISYQRGRPVVFSEDSIWAGNYIGFPGGFRHEPLFPGLGNIFHNSVVRNKEVDFFISKDNIYALNGLQPVPIGDQIFERFINDVVITEDTSVRGFVNSRKSQVFWIYNSTARSQLWSIVFNYKENKWSERSAQTMTAFFDSPRTKVRGYTVVDDHAEMIDYVPSPMIDALENISRVVPQLCCVQDAAAKYSFASFESAKVALSTANLACLLETFDFYADDFLRVKEVTKIVFELIQTGATAISLYIGTRKNQSASITWSAAISSSDLETAISYFVRTQGIGRYIRLRLTWTNSASAYVSELLLLSITQVTDSNANTTK
jgi:hypothetical protein